MAEEGVGKGGAVSVLTRSGVPKSGAPEAEAERYDSQGGEELGLLRDVKYFDILYFAPNPGSRGFSLLETKCADVRELISFLKVHAEAIFFIVKSAFETSDGEIKELRQRIRRMPATGIKSVPGEYLVSFPAGAMTSSRQFQRNDLIKYLEDCFCGGSQMATVFEKIVTVPDKNYLY
ncbi:MAG: hypothetical protein PHP03_02525 [Candidatus Pacebacteria bacterium]|nr:hypothetical protein [Candidatus Paceibacterota bacterium]